MMQCLNHKRNIAFIRKLVSIGYHVFAYIYNSRRFGYLSNERCSSVQAELALSVKTMRHYATCFRASGRPGRFSMHGCGRFLRRCFFWGTFLSSNCLARTLFPMRVKTFPGDVFTLGRLFSYNHQSTTSQTLSVMKVGVKTIKSRLLNDLTVAFERTHKWRIRTLGHPYITSSTPGRRG